MQRNVDPTLHPFEKAREYTRALNAVKLDRMFAKPFVCALDGHIDGVYSLCKNPKRLNEIVSGSADGQIRIWDLGLKQTRWSVQAHSGFVRGICLNPLNENLMTCGDDRSVKVFDNQSGELLNTFQGKHAFSGIDHHRSKQMFATSSSRIDIWDQERSSPVQTFEWGADTINTIKFNQTEVSVLASCGTDRTTIFYDIRFNSPLAKLVTTMKNNAIAWNPMEAFRFAAASEDNNVYLYDMRFLNRSVNVMKDHVSAVLDVDFSPTGQEVVSGSYDRSIRIFRTDQGHSRDIYHTKRMQRVFAVKYTLDSRFIISGSDDGNVRLWKAHASEKLTHLKTREKASLEYQEKLVERYKHLPEVRRIDRQRMVPGSIKSAQAKKKVMLDSRKRREANDRRHRKEDERPIIPERSKSIVKVEE